MGRGGGGDDGGAEARSRSLMMSNGFDGSEVGVFGEGAESLPAPSAVLQTAHRIIGRELEFLRAADAGEWRKIDS